MTDVQIAPDWKELLKEEFDKPYFSQLISFLKAEKLAGKTIYPPGRLIFNAFDTTPVHKVSVVILGQDPYHGPGQAHGLSFSVPQGIKPPPSLANIFKELNNDLGIPIPATGNLEPWAQQGVMLLNASLTVVAGQANAHSQSGWHSFTDAVIARISALPQPVVFMLWGRFAQQKVALINTARHLVLTAPHPSPFSVHTGFFGCTHFSRANSWLIQQGRTPINWAL